MLGASSLDTKAMIYGSIDLQLWNGPR